MRGKRGQRGVLKRGGPARARIYEESKQEEVENPEDDIINQELQALQRQDDIPKLTEAELEANIERILTPNNPQAPQNFAFFSYKDRTFKKDELVDQIVIHFHMDGSMLYRDSNEARDQEEFIDSKKLEANMLLEASAVDEGMPTELDHATLLKSLRNQFNYAERTAQTFSVQIKERGISTEPPPTQRFCGTVTQWDIYDTYMNELDLHKHLKKSSNPPAEGKKSSKKKGDQKEDPLFSSEMNYALKIMERMVNQNDLQFTYNAFKYVDFATDQTRSHESSLNELWTFHSEKIKKREVTALAWNPKYHDMFAVGYGSYNFMKRTTGLICCFSLKNTRYPEFFFNTPEGVMCLDWHPQHPALLAVGLYDGTVMVFDVRSKHKKCIYQSTVRTHKHTDPVWQVKWQDEDVLKNLSFFSISTDGRVTNWVLMKNKLEPEEVIKLKLISGQREGEEDETALSGLAGGTCFDFNPFQEHIFIVGTEEGKIHKCNKAYSGQYLETYEGHYMAVYAVKWNPYHPKVFLSSSADWTVKMWDHTIKAPLLTFDLGVAVGEIAWAPYSSTIFAAITADSKCHVFDLNVDKHSALSDKKILTGKLNHLAFNPIHPIIIIGNDRGNVKSFKLSPNLQKRTKPLTDEEKEKGITEKDLEIKKMEDLLASIDRNVY